MFKEICEEARKNGKSQGMLEDNRNREVELEIKQETKKVEVMQNMISAADE